MNAKLTQATIRRLFDELRTAIDQRYRTNDAIQPYDARDRRVETLRDYVTNQSWTDALDRLVDREEKHERRHQSGRPASLPRPRYSKRTLATALMMHLIAESASDNGREVLATDYLVMRDSAFEASVLGSIMRGHLAPEWIASAKALDYSELAR